MSDKFPTKITVLGQKIKVQQAELDDLYGDFTPSKKTIRINEKLTEEEKYQTLLHEAIHASLELAGWSHALSHETEEGIVRAIENGLWPLVQWRFNKKG